VRCPSVEAHGSERLDSIVTEAAGLGEQACENVLRVQELQTDRTNVRRQMVEEGCSGDT
jgi:hypothetical protein